MAAFTRHLSGSHATSLFDVDFEKARALSRETGAVLHGTLREAVADADLVILCTPLRETPRLIREAASAMREGGTLCEITSIKRETVPALREAAERGVKPLSLHPMFGPVSTLDGQTMAVVEVVDGARELETARGLFPGLRLVEVDAACHDDYMALVIALPYFMNVAFAGTLPSGDSGLLTLAGTTFRAQLALAECVTGEDPELIEALINGNLGSVRAINAFIDEARFMRRILKGNPERFVEKCRRLDASLSKDPSYPRVREARGVFLRALQHGGLSPDH